MTEGQAVVLEAIKAGNRTPNEIAAATGKTRQTVRSLLLALNAKGLVKRKLNVEPAEWRPA